MRLFVIGGGGREHALVWKLAQSPHVREIVCAPGNAGIGREAKCRNVPIKADDIPTLIRFAEEERIDLTVVGPELPLTLGIVDQWPKGQRIFGPTGIQALLESSKIHAKMLMAKHGVPTARFEICDTMAAAHDAILGFPSGKCVVKADGLAGGKGAIPCQDSEEAEKAAYGMLIEENLGAAGKVIVSDASTGSHARGIRQYPNVVQPSAGNVSTRASSRPYSFIFSTSYRQLSSIPLNENQRSMSQRCTRSPIARPPSASESTSFRRSSNMVCSFRNS